MDTIKLPANQYPGSPEDQKQDLGNISSEVSLAGVGDQANYQGNWMELQTERMYSGDFRERFIKFRLAHIDSLNEGTPGILDKPKTYKAHYAAQLEGYERNMETVNGVVYYGQAQHVGSGNSLTLGHGGIGESGTVFSDSDLTDRQKGIIAAHEAYHGMVDVQGSDRAIIMQAFNWDVPVINERKPGYLLEPDELLARMAQLKNYYGMKGGEIFTPDHLSYARQHYIEDTQLDNSMGAFFQRITPDKEAVFIEVMNTLPV